MGVVNAAGTGPERRIALIQPRFATDEQAGHAVQLFDSVLWVFKGTTRSIWVTSDADAAHVVIAHHSEPPAQLDAWREAGKFIITLSTDGQKHPAGPRTLVYPVPAVQVLSVLERVEAEMEGWEDSSAQAAPTVANTAPPGADPWSFVEALRTLRAVNNPSIWVVCQGTTGPLLWIRGDGAQYCCDNATAQSIHAGTMSLSGLTPQKGSDPPREFAPRPGVELFWFATYYASAALAPWLNQKAIFRLIRWPDFGRLRPSDATALTTQIRIVAALNAGSASISALSVLAQATVEQTARIVNALAVCGLTEMVQTAASRPRQESSVSPPAGGFKQFLRNLRKHLGMGTLA
ncbi:MAG: hypothetical protein ABW171_18235 [Steroidobacter sp.]